MFEDVLVESSQNTGTKKGRTVAASAVMHGVLIVVLIFVPLVFTESIEGARLASYLIAPPLPAPLGAAMAPTRAAMGSASVPASVPTPIDQPAFVAPVDVPRDIAYIVDTLPDGMLGVIGSSTGSSTGDGPIGSPNGDPHGIPGLPSRTGSTIVVPPPPPKVVVIPASPPPPPTVRTKEPVRISAGVQAGNALYQPNPEYPRLARISRVEGAVVLQAVITEDGSIKSLNVISASNPLLRTGVEETVRTWKYKPTLLSGEPVEVITTITINFKLGQN